MLLGVNGNDCTGKLFLFKLSGLFKKSFTFLQMQLSLFFFFVSFTLFSLCGFLFLLFFLFFKDSVKSVFTASKSSVYSSFSLFCFLRDFFGTYVKDWIFFSLWAFSASNCLCVKFSDFHSNWWVLTWWWSSTGLQWNVQILALGHSPVFLKRTHWLTVTAFRAYCKLLQLSSYLVKSEINVQSSYGCN